MKKVVRRSVASDTLTSLYFVIAGLDPAIPVHPPPRRGGGGPPEGWGRGFTKTAAHSNLSRPDRPIERDLLRSVARAPPPPCCAWSPSPFARGRMVSLVSHSVVTRGRRRAGTAKMHAVASPHFVIAGLDPAIPCGASASAATRHCTRPFTMDRRVKPGGDEGTSERPQSRSSDARSAIRGEASRPPRPRMSLRSIRATLAPLFETIILRNDRPPPKPGKPRAKRARKQRRSERASGLLTWSTPVTPSTLATSIIS